MVDLSPAKSPQWFLHAEGQRYLRGTKRIKVSEWDEHTNEQSCNFRQTAAKSGLKWHFFHMVVVFFAMLGLVNTTGRYSPRSCQALLNYARLKSWKSTKWQEVLNQRSLVSETFHLINAILTFKLRPRYFTFVPSTTADCWQTFRTSFMIEWSN